jgi:hypothetical protein
MSPPSAPRRRPSPHGAALERDDRLLTALAEGRAEEPIGGDPVAGLLGAWRREVLRAGDHALRRPAEPVDAGARLTRRPGTQRPPAGRWRRTGLVVAAAAVAPPVGDEPATTGPKAGPTAGTGPTGADAKGTAGNGGFGGRTDARPGSPRHRPTARRDRGGGMSGRGWAG